MKYAVLCYHAENVVCAWSREHDEEVMAKLTVVQERRARMGQLGPVARLMPTTAATTLRQEQEPAAVLDGPFAETKEQLLGFFVIDAKDLADALDFTRELAEANPGGAYEVRPIGYFRDWSAGP